MRGMGLGLGLRLGSSLRAIGGGLPSFAFPSGQMSLGVGMAPITTFGGYFPFANLMWNSFGWERYTGSAAWTQEWGILTTAGPTDKFRAFLCDLYPENLPSGTYTILNPDGCKIGVGAFTSPDRTGWSTATEFTFTHSGTGLLFLHAEGSVTNSAGPIQIILPGLKTAFLAGDYWNPVFMDFISDLNLKSLRFMDWLSGYKDLSESWSDVPVGLPMMTAAPITKLESKVPYPLIIDLCNRLNIDPHIVLPVRSNESYHQGLATLLKNTLNPDRYVYLEFGNETWNFGAPFKDARVWVELFDFTRFQAVSNLGINGWTLTAHGLSTGDQISNYFDAGNYTFDRNAQIYPSGYGERLYVEAVDANNFKLYENVGRTIIVAPTSLTPKLTYKKRVESGKVADIDINHGKQSLIMWQRFDAILGRNRCIHVMGTQFAGPAGTTTRLSPTGVAAATDVVGIAPYYQGEWWIGMVDIATTQLTPRFWSVNGVRNCRVALYASGSTPTEREIMAGLGTGYIAHRDMARSVIDNSASYTAGSAFTGLTDGTSYALFYVYTDGSGDRWVATGSATVSATPSRIVYNDGYENWKKRGLRQIAGMMTAIPAQVTASGGKTIICYESGSDYMGPGYYGATPAEVATYRADMTQSAQEGDCFAIFHSSLAAAGVKLAQQFNDVNATPGVFNMAESVEDTSDYRYQYYNAQNGLVAVAAPLSIANITAAQITDEPSYPHVVSSLGSGALTYTLYNGDPDGKFAVVGNELRLISGGIIDWDDPSSHTVKIQATDGNTATIFTVTVVTGDLPTSDGIGAPLLTGIPTLPASWDPESASSLTLTGDRIDAIAGADGTSYALTSSGSARPKLVTRSGKKCIDLTASAGEFLQVASALGLTDQCTIVMIAENKDTAANHVIFAVQNDASSATESRIMLASLGSSLGNAGYQHRSYSASEAINATSFVNTTALTLSVSQTRPNQNPGALIYLNGVATATALQATTSTISGLNRTSLGARYAAGVAGSFADFYVYRVLVYASGSLNSIQREELAVWAAANYGTTNSA